MNSSTQVMTGHPRRETSDWADGETGGRSSKRIGVGSQGPPVFV